MATLSTNTSPLDTPKKATALLRRLITVMRPAPKSPEQHRQAEELRAEARARVDDLLR